MSTTFVNHFRLDISFRLDRLTWFFYIGCGMVSKE